MPLLTVLIAAIIVGVVLYLCQLIPMDETLKQIVRVVVIAVFVIWMIRLVFGLAGGALFQLS